MTRRTKGMVEAALAAAVVRFHREQHGRGPEETRAHVVANLVVVRSVGILTPIEAHLAVTDEGRRLVRSARQELRSIVHAELEGLVAEIACCTVLRSYGDVNVDAAEQVDVFVLSADLERRLEWVGPAD